jgi:alkylation response protein AidB-like acyl-CoA dehydrogenase
MIHLFGSPAQKAKYLPGLCAGKIKAAVALTDTKEDAEGAENAAGWTTAEPAEDEFAISGTKPYVINGPICDAALVSARIGSAGNHRAALFLVDADLPGLVRSERQATLGVRGAHIGSLEFTRCLVRNENILGGEGGAEKALTALHARQCLWWAIYGVGVGQASIDAAKNHAGSRLIAGKRIAKHQEVHMKIAEMHMYTDTARLLALKAAWQLDQGSAEDGIAQSAKILATEMAARCSHQALQIHGGKGYFQGEPIERIFRDARLGELAGETSEILRGELAAGVFAQVRS